MSYTPLTAREYALVHVSYVPPVHPLHEGPTPTTTRPTRPAMPDGLDTSEQAQVNTWLGSVQDDAAYAAVTLPDAIAKVDEFKAFFAADRAWLLTKELDRQTTWRGAYVDSMLRNHFEEVVPPSQTIDGVPVNPPASPVPRYNEP